MKLTNTLIKNAKAKDKAYKLTDGDGMYLKVTTKGHKYWRMDYRFNHKRKTLSIGVYPTVTLKEAREARHDAKKLIAQGIDPSTHKKANKLKKLTQSENTFEGRGWRAQATTQDTRQKKRIIFIYEKQLR